MIKYANNTLFFCYFLRASLVVSLSELIYFRRQTLSIKGKFTAIIFSVFLFIDVTPFSPPQGRSSSDSHSSDEAGGDALSLSGDHQVQTMVQGQAHGSGRPCRALSPGIEMETSLQEMEMQTHQLDMCSPRCSPGEQGNTLAVLSKENAECWCMCVCIYICKIYLNISKMHHTLKDLQEM